MFNFYSKWVPSQVNVFFSKIKWYFVKWGLPEKDKTSETPVQNVISVCCYIFRIWGCQWSLIVAVHCTVRVLYVFIFQDNAGCITLPQLSKWLKNAGIIDGRKVGNSHLTLKTGMGGREGSPGGYETFVVYAWFSFLMKSYINLLICLFVSV